MGISENDVATFGNKIQSEKLIDVATGQFSLGASNQNQHGL